MAERLALTNPLTQLLDKERDEDLNGELARMPADERLTATRQVMHRDIHRN